MTVERSASVSGYLRFRWRRNQAAKRLRLTSAGAKVFSLDSGPSMSLIADSFLLKNFHSIPRLVRRLLFIFERAFKIHLRECIFRIEFEKLGKEDSCFGKVALTEFSKPGLVELDPLEKLPLPRAVFRTDQGEDLDWPRRTFHLHQRDTPEMKFITDQLAGAGANQNIHWIRPRQRFQARREIHRVA